MAPGISAFALITTLERALLLGNRNNKPVLIVGRDGQGMSRQSVLAAVPSCCRVTQWSNVVLHGNVAVLGDRDRLAARALPSAPAPGPSSALGPPLRLRSGAMPERGALGPHLVIRRLTTGTSALYLSTCPSLPPVLPPQPYRHFSPPYQSSFLKVCCRRPSNKTVHHMRHCFCTHSSSTSCTTQTTHANPLPRHPQ